MATNLYVGGISYHTEEPNLQAFVEAAGFQVIRAKIIMDRETGRSRGFGFVEVESDDSDAAVAALDGKELDGRRLRVNVAQDRGDRAPRGRGGPRGGGGRRRD